MLKVLLSRKWSFLTLTVGLWLVYHLGQLHQIYYMERGASRNFQKEGLATVKYSAGPSRPGVLHKQNVGEHRRRGRMTPTPHLNPQLMEAVKEDKNCVILQYDPPLLHEIHPQCFLQKYCLKYDIQPRNICSSNNDLNLFVFIYSVPSSFQRRQLIRKTWTDRTYFTKQDLNYVFLIGYEGSDADKSIIQEAEKYNDIVVIDIALSAT